MVSPLQGTRIIDLNPLLPGSYCTMILADMGADVVKIQNPRGWSPNRSDFYGPPSGKSERESLQASNAYDFVNRNKRSIVLDLKQDAGRSVFRRLAENADVLVEGFRPGVSKRLGVDYETVKELNPGIIYVSITGYGQNGPYANWPGHDPNYLAISGILGATGTQDGRHVLPLVPMADLAGGGMQAALGVLLALVARGKTGRGQFVDISMVDEMVSWLIVSRSQAYFTSGWQPKIGQRLSHVYQTKDQKYISIFPIEPWFWERLCRILGMEEYIPYESEVLIYDKGTSKSHEIVSRFSEVFRTKTRQEWVKILLEADIAVAPVQNYDEVFSDPHILHRKMIVELNHPILGRVKYPGVSIKLSDTPGEVKRLAPLPGENTEEILRELGCDEELVQQVVQQAGHGGE